jgi:cytochrome d ubiquinol oxidase subunit II
MTLAEWVLGVMFVGLIAYGLFGGPTSAPGSGTCSPGERAGGRQRDLIEHSIGPCGRPTTSG